MDRRHWGSRRSRVRWSSTPIALGTGSFQAGSSPVFHRGISAPSDHLDRIASFLRQVCRQWSQSRLVRWSSAIHELSCLVAPSCLPGCSRFQPVGWEQQRAKTCMRPQGCSEFRFRIFQNQNSEQLLCFHKEKKRKKTNILTWFKLAEAKSGSARGLSLALMGSALYSFLFPLKAHEHDPLPWGKWAYDSSFLWVLAPWAAGGSGSFPETTLSMFCWASGSTFPTTPERSWVRSASSPVSFSSYSGSDSDPTGVGVVGFEVVVTEAVVCLMTPVLGAENYF